MNNKKIKNTLSDALNSAGKQEAFLDNISNKTRYQNVKSREGKRMVAAYFTADIHKSLKMLAVQNGPVLRTRAFGTSGLKFVNTYGIL